MCLAIPGKVTEFEKDLEPLMGKVNFNGVLKRVCLEWIPDLKIGDYVIVHAGFAISRLDEEEALETLRLFKQMEESIENDPS